MTENIKHILTGQYEAALAMMKFRIEACPAEYWEDKVATDTFREIAYHALFFYDYYLSPNDEGFKLISLNVLGGDEREPVVSQGLSKAETLEYVMHIRGKILDSLSAETTESLNGPGFPTLFKNPPISRLELHLYNIRHLQHHIGQLSTYLRKISDEHNLSLELKWVGTGWR
jgi:hypothetical protein